MKKQLLNDDIQRMTFDLEQIEWISENTDAVIVFKAGKEYLYEGEVELK